MANLLSDADVFGSAPSGLLSDADVFGKGAKTEPGGFVASAKQALGAGIKGAGQAAADFIPGVSQENALKRYGQEIIEANPTAVHSFSDLADKPWTAVKEATGNALSSMGGVVGARALGTGITAAAPLAGPAAPIVAGAGQAISWLGPVAAAALPSFGGIREQQIHDDPNATNSAAAKAAAAVGAGTVGAIESRFGPEAWGSKMLTEAGRNEVAKLFAAKTLPQAVAKGAVRGAAVEGAEELAQNPVEQLAAFQNPLTAEALKDTAFSGAMGALGGGVLGGGTGAASRYLPKKPDVAPGNQPAEPPKAPPAPTYTGTPGDQTLQATVDRQNAVDAAQAATDALYNERDAFERERAANMGGPTEPPGGGPTEPPGGGIDFTPPQLPDTGPLSRAANLALGASVPMERQAFFPFQSFAAAERMRNGRDDLVTRQHPSIPGRFTLVPAGLETPVARQAKPDVQQGTGSFSDQNELANFIADERKDQSVRKAALAEGKNNAIAQADQAVADARQFATRNERLSILDGVLSSLAPGQNPNRRFDAALKAAGFRDTSFTEEERTIIGRYGNAASAFAEAPTTPVEPSSPNEMGDIIPAAPGKGNPGIAGAKIDRVRSAIAAGFTQRKGFSLINPATGEKFSLKTPGMIRAAKEALEKLSATNTENRSDENTSMATGGGEEQRPEQIGSQGNLPTVAVGVGPGDYPVAETSVPSGEPAVSVGDGSERNAALSEQKSTAKPRRTRMTPLDDPRISKHAESEIEGSQSRDSGQGDGVDNGIAGREPQASLPGRDETRPSASEGQGPDERPSLELEHQTDQGLADKAAREQEPQEPTKEQADRERDAAPFSLAAQSQPKPQGVQSGLFTADGRVSVEAKQPEKPAEVTKPKNEQREAAGLPAATDGGSRPVPAVSALEETFRPLIERLIRNKRVAKELGFDIDGAIAKAKAAMAGTKQMPGSFRALAKRAEKKGDTETAAILNQIADLNDGRKAKAAVVKDSLTAEPAGNQNPIKKDDGASTVDPAAHEAASSPKNDKPEEVKPIAEAFDSLFSVIESRETEKGVALESRAPSFDSSDAPQTTLIRRVVDSFLARFQGAAALDIRVVASRNEIPLRYRPSPYAEGVYHDADGVVYLISSNLPTQARAWQVLMHEAIGHYGLSNLMGEKFAALQATILQKATSGRELTRHPQPGEADYATVEAVRRLYPEASDSEVAQEVLARMAEMMEPPGWSKILFAQVRHWLRTAARAMNLTVEPSLQEAKDAVVLAAKHLRDGNNLEREMAGDGQAFASEGAPSGGFKAVEDWAASLFAEQGGANPNILESRSAGPVQWKAPEPSRLDDLIYSMQDKHVDMKRVVQSIKQTAGTIADNIDPYLQEELFHGRAAKAVKDFLDLELRPLIAEMRMRGVGMADFEEYLWNRHAEERNAQIAKINPQMPDGGSGLATADARAYLAGLSSDKRKAYESLAAKIDAITARNRQVLVDSGLEKAETVAAWEGAYKHYVPLQREDVETGGNGTGQGFSVRGTSSKRAVGSGRPVADIIANLAMQRERFIVKAEKNRVSIAIAGLAASNPNPDFWKLNEAPKERVVNNVALYNVLDANGNKVADFTRMDEAERMARSMGGEVEQTWGDRVQERIVPGFKNQENVVHFRLNGDDHFVVFNEREPRALRMAQSIKNLDMDQLGRVLTVAGKATRYFASINTQYNPIFGVINLFRDVQGALLNLSTTPLAGEQKRVAGYTVDALRGIYADIRAHRSGKVPSSRWASLYEEFQNEGGQTGYRDQFSNAEQRAEAIAKEIRSMDRNVAFKATGAVFDWLSDYNQAMENAVRLAAYAAAKDRGLSKQQAASLAKNLTVNFNRKGQVATQMGALYAFFNASMQGTARLAQTLTGPMGRRIITGGILLGSMQALLLASAGMGDDEPPEFVRERNLILPIGDGKYISLPMPLGFHVLPNLGRIPVEFVMSGFREPARRISDLVAIFADTFNPIGNAGLSLQTIAPTVVDPFAALAENKDWTGKPIAKMDMNANSPTPGHSRAKDTSTVWSKSIAEAINYLSGGTKYKPGVVSPTPDQIDYLIGQVTGGVGREAAKAEQTVTSTIFTGEELPLHKVPLVGRFVGDTKGQSAEGSKFYAALQRINEHENEIKGMRKDGRGAEIAGYIQDNPEARLMLYSNHVEREVQKLRAAKRDALERGDEGRVRMIESALTAKMRAFNERVRSAQGSAN